MYLVQGIVLDFFWEGRNRENSNIDCVCVCVLRQVQIKCHRNDGEEEVIAVSVVE